MIGSKRNNVKVASRKRITKLINAQEDMDRKATVTMQKQKISKIIPNSRENPQLQFFVPNPKGSAPQTVPIMQDKEEEEEEEQEMRRSQRIRNQQTYLSTIAARHGSNLEKRCLLGIRRCISSRSSAVCSKSTTKLQTCIHTTARHRRTMQWRGPSSYE